MGSISFAISIHKFVSSTGADAGFASIIGLAILILLFFAQARETSTLRQQASEAAARVGELEARIAELARQAAAQVVAGEGDAAAGAANAAAAAAGHASVAEQGAVPAGVGAASAVASRRLVHIGPPAGVAAPALAAATRLIPLATDNGSNHADAALDWPPEPISVERVQPAPAPATVAAGNGANHGRVPPVAASPRRRVQPGVGGAGARPGAPSRRPLLPPEPPRRRSPWVTALVALLGLAVVGAAVAALLIVTSTKSTSTSSTVASRTTNAPAARRLVSFNPRSVTVSVLNGTATAGLAHRTALRLAGAGYRQGTVATATDQTRTTTQVSYLPGDRSDALRVASTLRLSSAAVAPIDSGTQAVACPPPAACTANVVVTVGADLSSTY